MFLMSWLDTVFSIQGCCPSFPGVFGCFWMPGSDSNFLQAMLFIGFLPGILRNTPAEVSRNMHIFVQCDKHVLTNHVNQHDQSYWTIPNSGHCYDCTTSLRAHEIDHIGIRTWAKTSSNPRVKTPPLWRKTQDSLNANDFSRRSLLWWIFSKKL